MRYIYSIFSIIGLVILYFANRRLTSSYYPLHNFYGVMISFLFVLFNMIVLRVHVIPILGIPVPEDDDFMYYGPLIYALLCVVISMLAHGKGRQ